MIDLRRLHMIDVPPTRMEAVLDTTKFYFVSPVGRWIFGANVTDATVDKLNDQQHTVE